MLLRLGALLALSYLTIMLLMWLFQEQLLYLPGQGREHLATPADIGLDWRAVELATEDDLRLGLSVLILDYRGYGKSEERPSEAGTALAERGIRP